MKNIIVITGASSGLGREFAHQLDGMNDIDEIWGIALNLDKLNEVKNEIKTPFKSFDFDLTKDENFDKYVQKLKSENVNIKMLINCSGFGKFGRYDEIPLEASANMIDLNCKALVKMTELSLPFISSGGRIIQIASVAGFQPIPYINVYGATKAFVVAYSRALNIELKPRNISVTCVCPFWTKTNFFNRAKATEHTVVSKYVVMYNADFVVKYALKKAMKRKELAIPGFIARSQVKLVKFLPHKLVMKTWVKQQKLNKKYK